MKKNFTKLIIAFIAITMTTTIAAQDQQQLKRERIITSYMITFGRQPNQGELNHWMGRENLSLEQLVKNHSQYLQSDKNEKRGVIIRAYKYSYGSDPNENQINQNMSSSFNYDQWVNNHVTYLRNNAKAWDDLLGKVYWNVCRRWATDNDKRSWPRSDPRPYGMVAAVVDKWQAENRHNSSKGVRNSSQFLNLFTISNIVANEAARLIGPAGGNVIAPGGGNVISAGGGNVVSAGGGNVVSAGGLNFQ